MGDGSYSGYAVLLKAWIAFPQQSKKLRETEPPISSSIACVELLSQFIEVFLCVCHQSLFNIGRVGPEYLGF